MGPESEVPHETREVRGKKGVTIQRDSNTVTLDIYDTPGVDTKVDYQDFMDHGMNEEDAKRRAREGTSGIAEAMKYLREDVDGVLYVLDSTEDPVSQVNSVITGIIESQDFPVLILANKTDKDGADVAAIEKTFDHRVVSMSALEGENMDEVYDEIAAHFG